MKLTTPITLPRLPILLLICVLISACIRDDSNTIQQQADEIVARMSLREKVAQKMMMYVRYWCADETRNCSDSAKNQQRECATEEHQLLQK